MSVRSFPARLAEVTDGDTVKMFVDLGDDLVHKWKIRFRGIDAPEKKDKEGWTTARDAVLHFLVKSDPGFPFTLVTEQTKDGSLEREKYGRFLGTIILPDGTLLAEQLLALGVVKPWNGQGPHPWLLLPPVTAVHVDLNVHGPDSLAAFVPRHNL
jgi:endonuclease YncB( thermonuclease family)